LLANSIGFFHGHSRILHWRRYLHHQSSLTREDTTQLGHLPMWYPTAELAPSFKASTPPRTLEHNWGIKTTQLPAKPPQIAKRLNSSKVALKPAVFQESPGPRQSPRNKTPNRRLQSEEYFSNISTSPSSGHPISTW